MLLFLQKKKHLLFLKKEAKNFMSWRGDPADSISKLSKICYRAGLERDTAIATLKAHEAELRQLGVRHLYLFGSTTRDEAQTESDVDLFFDYDAGKLSLFGLMKVKEQATRFLGCSTDIMTRDSLHPAIRARVGATALRVF